MSSNQAAKDAFLALLTTEQRAAYLALNHTNTAFDRDAVIAEIVSTDWTTVPDDNLKKIRALAKRPEITWTITEDGKLFLHGKYEVVGQHLYKAGMGLVFKKGCGRLGGTMIIDKIEDPKAKAIAINLPEVEKND